MTNTEDFTDFLGAGFDQTGSSGRLDSDNIIVRGLSDGSLAFGDTRTTGDFARGSSAVPVTEGGVYSFSSLPANIGSLGLQPTDDDLTPGSIVARYFNGTGQAITSLQIGYTILVRNDQNRSSTVDFEYALGSCALTDPGGLTFTRVGALSYTSPGASTGTAFQTVSRSTTITGLSVTGQTCIYLAFVTDDAAGTGDRDELALDDLAVTPTTTPETASVTFQAPASGTVTEGTTIQATLVLTLTNDGGAQSGLNTAVTGTLAYQSGSATQDDVSFGTFTFPVGSVTGATATVAITGNDDTVFEGTEAAVLGFGNVSGATASGTYSLTITDTDPEPSVVINEVDPDQGDSDTAEFVELRGTPSQLLNAFVVVFADATGTSVAAADLDFVATGNTGYAVLCSTTTQNVPTCNTNAPAYTVPDGTGIVALYVGAASDYPPGTPLTTANLRSAVVYGPARSAALLARVGETVQYLEGYAGTAAPTPATRSLARTAAGLYVSQAPSPGVPNAETVTVDRTADVGGAAGYRLFSAPVVKPNGTSRVNVADLAAINLVQGVAAGSDADGSYSAQYPAAPGPNLYLAYQGGSGYTAAATTADDLEPGRGFFWRLYDRDITPSTPEPFGPGTSQSYALGNPAFQLALTGVPLGNTAGAPLAVPFTQHADGFYMLGNPFAYPLYLGGVSPSSGTFQTTFQTYDGTSFQPREASFSTPANGAAVAPWQGFFAESADLTGAGTPFSVRYDARRLAPTAYATDLVGRPAGEVALRLRLDGTTAEGAALLDVAAVVRVDADASAGWDRGDASKLTPPEGPFALVAPVGERGGAPYRQAVLTLPALGDVTLAFTTTHAGSFTLTADATGLPATATVRDLVSGTVAPLADGLAFTSDATEWTERFVVSAGGATAGETAPASVSLGAVYPNPASAGARIALRVDAAQTVRATVVDALGRTVATVFEGALSAGQSQTLAIETAGLAPGVYAVRVTGATFTETRRLVVAR